MYRITFSKQADKTLRKMPRNLALKIAEKIIKGIDNRIGYLKIKKKEWENAKKEVISGGE